MCPQHILHSIQAAGIKKWVALQEGAGYTLGWLTVSCRHKRLVACSVLTGGVLVSQTNERKEAMW